MPNKKKIVISGSGLIGSLLSIYLARRGHEVELFEKRADMRKVTMSAGKSINLALSDRGILGLKGANAEHLIQDLIIPMYGRMIHPIDGKPYFLPYGKKNQAINSVSRGEINKRLMDIAEKLPNVKIHFEHRFSHTDGSGYAVFIDKNNHEIKSAYDILFGADGAFSGVRLHMQLTQDRFDYHQFFINCSYKELLIPPGPGNSFLIEKNALHIWPRKDFMMIALPNPDGNFTCTLFLPNEGPVNFSQLQTPSDVEYFFKEHFPDAVTLMPTLKEDFFSNPTSSLVTVKCYPWVFNQNTVALIGDAAHAIVPFFGQGMNCGFEDCYVLNQLLDKYEDNFDLALPEYQLLRKPDGDAIADLAIGNFIEMRDKTARPEFILQKKIEQHVHERHPNAWIPLYSMVTYSPHIRYSEALRKGQQLQEIMDEVLKMPGIEEKWDSPEVEEFMLRKAKEKNIF
ncbi:MAG: FAD-dependent monooxygenase [Bacteroidia bacterium]|nr:FAD-dependent monooxygenase [Bacteroidia bacterium]